MTLATIALCTVLPNMYSFMHKAARGALNVIALVEAIKPQRRLVTSVALVGRCTPPKCCGCGPSGVLWQSHVRCATGQVIRKHPCSETGAVHAITSVYCR